MPMEHFLKNAKYTFPYRVYGNGPKALLAFHGFGRSGEDFAGFGRSLGDRFTMYAFDLPYHGKGAVMETTTYPVFTKTEMMSLFTLFLDEKSIDRFSLMGYSLGGKIALGALEVFGRRVEAIYLLAPDGLKVNPFYFLGTRTWLGRLLFERMIKHPERLFALGDYLEKRKWMQAKINYFMSYHMNTEWKRKRVFDVWMVFRKFIPGLRTIASLINKHNITILLFFGRYDGVIPPRLAKKIVPRLKKKDVVTVLECGHRVMERDREVVRQIKESFKEG